MAALAYLHGTKNIVHRDIKPANLLVEIHRKEIEKIDIKLTDFGFATFKENSTVMSQKVGTLYYMAPELVAQRNASEEQTHNFKVDVWAAGVMTFELLSEGHFPFEINDDIGEDENDVKRKILEEEP